MKNQIFLIALSEASVSFNWCSPAFSLDESKQEIPNSPSSFNLEVFSPQLPFYRIFFFSRLKNSGLPDCSSYYSHFRLWLRFLPFFSSSLTVAFLRRRDNNGWVPNSRLLKSLFKTLFLRGDGQLKIQHIMCKVVGGFVCIMRHFR